MSGLDLDETEAHMFEHAATNQYGAIVCGGTPDERVEAVLEQLDANLVHVDCREADSSEDVVRQAVLELTDQTPEDLEKRYSLDSIDLRRALSGSDADGLLLIEFDSMDSATRTSVAQMMKGFVEQGDPTLAYTCSEGDAVTRAEPDLRARVRAWELE